MWSWVQKILKINYPASENNSSSLAQIWEELKRATEVLELRAPVWCPFEFLFSLFFLITIELQPVTFLNHLQGADCGTFSAATLLRQYWHVVFVRRRPHTEEQHHFSAPSLMTKVFLFWGTAVRMPPSKGCIEQILYTLWFRQGRVLGVGGLPRFPFHEL